MTFVTNILYYIVIFFEGIAFQLASYTYKLFSLMCQLNFNSLYAIVSPLIDRLQAVIIVLVLYKLASALINIMVNPDKMPEMGAKLIKNIAIAVVLLILHNLIFSFMNELSMLILGAPPGYSYTVLNELAGVTGGEEDEGLIMRFIFGEETDVSEIGDYIAFETMSIFLHDTTDTQDVENALYDGEDGYNFMNMYKVVPKIGKTVYYFPLPGLAIALFLVYTFFNLAAEMGIRVFKLLILQMIAPLAIITIITEGEGLNSPTWKNYWKEYTSIYLSIFIRVLTTLVITVIISKFVINIGDFFGSTLVGDGFITNGLLVAIVIFAGYKFVLDAPKLLSKVFPKFDPSGGGSGNGFASFLGGALVGGATGLATGLIGGAASARNSGGSGVGAAFNGVGGALVGGLGGFAQGVYSGSKGNNIAENIKNGYAVRQKTKARSDNWYQNGGMFNSGWHSAVNGVSNFTGITASQDRRMAIYDEQENAVKAYEEAVNQAQIDAIKGTSMSTSEEMVIGREADGTEVRMATSDIYSGGYESIKLGDNASTYAQQMLEFDREYQQTQAVLEQAKSSGDATAIAEAQRKNLQARNEATKRANDYWQSKKSNATYSDDKISKQRADANRALSKTGPKREATADINVSAVKQDIKTNKSNLQNKTTYKHSHKGK